MIATLRTFNRSGKKMVISRLRLRDATIRLATDSSRVTNLAFLVDALRPPPDSNRVKMEMVFNTIQFESSRFIYENHAVDDRWDKGIDWSEVRIDEMDLNLTRFRVYNDSVSFRIRHLDFQERSGLDVISLSAEAILNRQFMDLKDIHLSTENSDILAEHLDFRFNSWKDFGNGQFGEKVRLRFRFLPSTIHLDDLAYFAPGLDGMEAIIGLNGDIGGRISSLKGKDMVIRYNSHLYFEGNFDMLGLPDFEETYMYFDIDNLTTNVNAIMEMQRPGRSGDTISLSESLSQLGNVSYKGKFAGFYNDFVTYGDFSTDLGSISSDLSIRPDSAENVHYRGKLSTRGFDIGKLLDMDETAGVIDMSGNVEGINYKGGEVDVNMDGYISLFEFNQYPYRNITLTGHLTNRTFDGSFSVEDPNLKMEFFGKIDFADTLPVFDFTANVENARLYPLKISASDPSYTLSCYLRANFVGANLDDFNGEINLVNSLFQTQDKQIQIYDFNLFTLQRPDTNWMTLRSDLVDADIWGQYEFVDIGQATARLLAHHIPAFQNLPVLEQDEYPGTNRFHFRFDFKNTFPITDFFMPDLELARNSILTGNYNPAEYELNFSGQFPQLKYRDNNLEDLNIELVSDKTAAEFQAGCSCLGTGGLISMENFEVRSILQNDSIFGSINWNNDLSGIRSMGDLGGLVSFERNGAGIMPMIGIEMEPGTVVLRDSIWNLDPVTIRIDTSTISIDRLLISHGSQYFLLDGEISRLPGRELVLTFSDFDLSHINQAFKKQGLEIRGVLNGSSTISDVYDKPTFLSDLSIDGFALNGESLGNTYIDANWVNSDQKIHLDARAMRGELKTLGITGDYRPETRELDFDLSLDKLRLNIIEPYLSETVSGLNGILSGEVNLKGTTRKPLFNGILQVQKTSFMVEYLQTVYNFSDQLEIRDNNLIFSDFEILDNAGSKAFLNGSIRNNYLRDFVFDLNLQAERFRFLSTRERHNPDYYGDAIVTGLLRFSGTRGDLHLNISARTDRGTHMFIPVSQGRSIKENNFITFVNKEKYDPPPVPEGDRSNLLSGFGLQIDLAVTPDAITEIIFDPQVGDIMKGNGQGNIQLLINPGGKFQMFGEYEIENGEYLFTLQNIINKKLEVASGGTIRWNGDPTGAVIDIRAIYNSRAAPSVLLPEAPEHLKKRMPVECHLIMTGNLLSPLIKFDIQMPTAEEETRNILRNAIGTEEELTRQFLSLLVMNSFSSVSSYAGTGSSAGTGVGMAGVTASESLSNLLSSWLSQISNDFDIGVNYRPGDEISSEQVEVALSTQIFDNRVTIHTNVDVSGQDSPTAANPKANSIAGDFDLDVKITENGKFRFKAYNRYNHDQLYKTAPYTQGIGFIYREDFNNLLELSRRYFRNEGRSEKNRE